MPNGLSAQASDTTDDGGEVPSRTVSSPNVRVGRTHVGKGVFARRRYQADTIIGEIEGDVIHDAEYGSEYCLDIGDGSILEPAAPFRYVNHSCQPNCEFDYFDLKTSESSAICRRVFLISLVKIEPGTQLTIDYNWPASAAIPCRCHAECCRGWIVRAEQLSIARANARLRAQTAWPG
jgi:hypothetical protein